MEDSDKALSDKLNLDAALNEEAQAPAPVQQVSDEAPTLDLSQSPQSQQFLESGQAALSDIPGKIAGAYESVVSPKPDEMQQKAMIANLEKSGVISPQTINNVDILLSKGYITQQQAEALRNKYGAPTTQMQANQAANQQQIAPIMQGTPLEQPQPVGFNTVLKQDVESAVRNVAAEQEAKQQAEMKAQEEAAKMQAAQQEEVAKQQALAAQQKEQALKNKAAQDAVRAEQAAQRAASIQKEVAQEEEEADDGIFNSKDSTADKWRKGIAIMLGGIAQGLGVKNNPALDYLEKQVERRIEQRKLNAEKANALRKEALERARLEIDKQRANTDSLIARAQYTKLLADIADKQGQIGTLQQVYAQARSGGIPSAALDSLPEEDRARAIPLPNGNFGLAVSAKSADKVRADLADMDDAARGLARLKELGNYFGNNPLKKVSDRNAVAEADTLQRAIIGKMRLSLFGPGVLTDTEQSLAAKIIRNPSDIFNLASANQAAFDALIKKLKFSQKHQLRSVGVDIPKSRNELILEQARKKYPKAKESAIISALIKQGVWQEE